ncbi:MAG: ABC transporter permease [Actinomycetota bacterium]|nr:ABC transporter permease [Actinomycetota bacterium]
MSSATIAASSGLRIVPAAVFEIRRPQRMLERSLMVTRRNWIIVFSGFFEPLFYLLSVRVGMSKLVGDVQFGGHTVDYSEFVAPALMAASAMNGAVYDATMNVFFKLKYAKLYDAVLSTPMTPADVALGEIGWAVTRGTLYAVAFLGTMWALGMTASPWVLLSVPLCMLIAFAFASVGMAVTTYMRSWVDFEYITAATLPLFLFSATFYPMSSYGEWGWIVQLSPLYHGVALVRAANTGTLGWSAFAHIAVLLAMTLVGLVIASRRVKSLLIK